MRALHGPGMDRDPAQRRAELPRPADALPGPEQAQQLDGLGQHLGPAFGVLPELRVVGAVDAAPADQLDAPAGERVHGGVVLGHAHGVVVGQEGDGGGEAQAARALGHGGEHGRGRGEDVVAEVVLAHVERVEAEALGERPQLDDLAEALARAKPPAAVGMRQVVAQRDEPDLHLRPGGGPSSAGRGPPAPAPAGRAAARTRGRTRRRGPAPCPPRAPPARPRRPPPARTSRSRR